MPNDHDLHRFSARYEPLLGTVVEVRVALHGSFAQVRADEQKSLAGEIMDAVADEMERLSEVFSAVSDSSELSCWSRRELDSPGAELSAVLESALDWQQRSDGRFNPASGLLSSFWRQAEIDGLVPDRDRVAEIARSIADPRWAVEHGRVVQTGDCRGINLNAFAKGWIVDRAAACVMDRFSPGSLSVNAGGDLVQIGSETLLVGIENPHRPFDNEPPIACVAIADQGLATSGGARRGFVIGGERFSHVIDPRTGWPVEHIASISVVGPDAATADVLATTLGMLEPDDAIAEADDHEVACLVIDAAGNRFANERWRQALSR